MPYGSQDTNSDLITEIKERFDYCVGYWAEIRKEGRHDMRCVSGDPWPPEERRAREDAKRLCLSLDELNQYTNATINGVRQNKRAIKVIPEGNGADDTSATFRAGIIRGIEYKCNAQAAYIRAFENALQRSYGYVKVKTDFADSRSSNQVLKIVSIPNPDTIYLDPDAKEIDFSDMEYAFELESLSERDYKEDWPKAEIRSFSPDHMKQAPGWITAGTGGYRVQVASYWKVRSKKRTLIYLPNGKTEFLDEITGAKLKDVRVEGLGKVAMVELPSGEVFQAHGYSDRKDKTVCQYITNGLEILEKKEWAGKTIPIVPCFAKELWIDEGAGAKRMLISLVRMAREPYLVYCYARTAQTELAGQAPKNVWMGYEGQFDTNTPWATINRTLVTYAEVKAKTEATGDAILPLPARNQFEPPIQALELLAEAARRAIQSAMGVNGLLSGKRGQDQSAKSGIALRELDKMADEGTYHFIDSYNGMLKRVGLICDEMMDTIYDTQRDVVSLGEDEKPSVVCINQKCPDTGVPIGFQVASGDHGVTITTGPPYDSLRQEVAEFASELASNPNMIAAAISGNMTAAKLLALTIKLRQLGPLGDKMADILSPPEREQGQIPPEIQQAMAQKDQELERAQSIALELHDKLESKQAEIESKERMQQKELDFKREELLVKTELEEMKAGNAAALAELNADIDRIKAERALALEAEQEEAARQQEAEEAERERQHALDLQRQQAERDAVQSDADREHEAGMAEATHQQNLELGQQAADLAPEPAKVE